MGICKKELFGINQKCRQCKDNCKQFKQVKVVFCPYFKALTKKK